MISCIDNFLDQDDFIKVKDLITSPMFSWHFSQILNDEDKEISTQVDNKKVKEKIKQSFCQSNFNYQFVHLFYYNNIPTCTYFQNYIEPIYNLLKGKALIKIKANLTSQTTDHILSGFHIDAFEDNYTSIFYINNNNGYTEFLDGTKIESRENRMLTFRGNCYHSGVSSTDQLARIVLNFNYFK
tara:strand:- start:309 stop:860 length:552 start_codon:yes stop_codon:yes gene_type:complete